MKKFSKILLLGLLVVLVAAFGIRAIAQEVGAGEGGAIIESNFGGDIATLNPILSSDGQSNAVISRMYPSLLTIDPIIGNIVQGSKGAVATSWEVSDDGLTYTFTLRDDWNWTDGTPITSADYKYAFDAISSGQANTSLGYVLDTIASVEAPDPTTLVITLTGSDCGALNNIGAVPMVPSHVFNNLFGTDYALMNDSDYNLNPTASAGIFAFSNFRPGEQVTLVANQGFPDSELGYVVPEGWIYKTVADQTVEVQQFLAGEITLLPGVPAARQAEFRERAANGEIQIFEAVANSTRFLGFNLADPNNPVNGLDDDGNPLDQGKHPIFGDVRVRQALAYGIDFDAINEGVFFGFGIPLATHAVPTSWAYPADLEPYPFDQEKARALLEEAGWTDSDGDGVRECNGCMYANPGDLLEFELLTNAGNASQEALGAVLQDVWGEIGFRVNFQAIDFNVLVETFVGQTFDAVMIFWGFGFPDDPAGVSVTFSPENDVVNSGFNAVSYYNARLEEILDEAKAVPGCDLEERINLYQEAYTILHEELPWLWLGTATAMQAIQANVENYAPYPNATRWNIDSWTIKADQ